MGKTQHLHELSDKVLLCLNHQLFFAIQWREWDIDARVILTVDDIVIIIAAPFRGLILTSLKAALFFEHCLLFQQSLVFIFSFLARNILKLLLVAIEFSANEHVLELHDVSRECSCLVWEDVSDLAEVLYDTYGLALDLLVSLPWVHGYVLSDDVALHHFANLKRYWKRDGQQCVQQNKVGAKG